ncbi:kinase-like protein [Gloeophyllum trabeum ATCC 11539]|uniref:Kinase-like protein n=1 Tax=Gloeophyllum trabeum (strain ATCC 11539 / FP-39264 / Madison 617) TaxID=670483 RepID=S7QAX8_GLOTA|nr:kinase-like protein [Gloeophyllum trabeum ATCC 11539]EPQ56483.1 kinase-like protein [Gloeophyllum trabeum ATCC 11539]
MAISPVILELPAVGSSFMEHVRGYLHRIVLYKLSRWYCRWFNITHDMGIYPLPFNLILKDTLKTRRAEALAMSLAGKIGIPVPRLLSYGSDPSNPSRGSILMSRLPGKPLDEVRDSLSPSEWATIREELAKYLGLMRSWTSPWGPRICSVEGGSVRGARIPGAEGGPWEDENAFHATFLEYATPENCVPGQSYEEQLSLVKSLASTTHPIVFTHGDLLAHNIMIHDGHISGIIDWEYAGWFPDYWEYTQILRGSSLSWWWPKFAMTLPGYKYEQQYIAYRAMWGFARNSFSW